jgi:hypothetical protein
LQQPRRAARAGVVWFIGVDESRAASHLPFMTRQEVLDLYFMDARAKLIDLAAFLDRVDRATGEADFRLAALKEAITALDRPDAERARRVLLTLSDPTQEPIARASGKGACGAWPGAGASESER